MNHDAVECIWKQEDGTSFRLSQGRMKASAIQRLPGQWGPACRGLSIVGSQKVGYFPCGVIWSGQSIL